MAGPWDSMTKQMIEAHPEDFINWLTTGATYVASLDTELKSQHIFADALLKILKEEELGVLHYEIQTYHDADMLVRLLEYNILASRQYDHLPVYSYVICLREEADVDDPPFIRRFLNGKETHRFYYEVIRVWLIPAEAFLQSEWLGLLPMVTLTQGGKQPEAVRGMIDRLALAEEWDLLAIAHVLGGLVFKKGTEREQFRKRFTMFQDVLRESWVYQEIGQEFLKKGLEQGLEKGLERGLEQGLEKGLEQGFAHGREEERKRRVQTQRQMLIGLLQKNFPELEALAKQQIANIDNLEILENITFKLLAAQRVDEAKKILFEADKH